ncbi:MAG: tetratricopeptide repeat protein [Acidobacteria bacterium]|nr:tetratricopeptide repeat protein [Acidobacteriota bacterium]
MEQDRGLLAAASVFTQGGGWIQCIHRLVFQSGITAVIGVLALPFAHLRAGPAQEPAPQRISVYPISRIAQAQDSLAVTAAGSSLRILSSSPIGASRTLLVIVDPSSLPKAEIRTRAVALGKALERKMHGRDPRWRIRVGVTVLGGILSDPLSEGGVLDETLLGTVTSFLPAGEEPEANPGRTLDLIEILLDKAESQDGALDCLILAQDRPLAGDHSDYLAAGAERRFLHLTSRRGSTLYGWMEETGVLSRLCRVTGGMVFHTGTTAPSMVEQLELARSRGRVLEVAPPVRKTGAGMFDLAVRIEAPGALEPGCRGPAAIWHDPEGVPPPGFYHMREGLAWMQRAADAAEQGSFVTALHLLDRSIQNDPFNPQAFYLAGRFAAGVGDLPEAARRLSRAIRFIPAADQVLELYADALRRLDRAPEALDTIRSLVLSGQLETDSVRLAMARLLVSMRRYGQARPLYEAILGTSRDGDQVRAEFGDLLRLSNNPEGAREQVRIALAQNPENVAALTCAAEIALSLRDTAEARSLALRALDARPQNPDVLLQLGRIEAAALNWGEAMQRLGEALLLAPERSDVLRSIAQVQVQTGMHSEALATLQQVLEIDPGDPSAVKEISDVYVARGMLSEAAGALEQGATAAGDAAHILLREAAELRERRTEYGQALLNYRAMLRALPPDRKSQEIADLRRHMDYLSMLTEAAAETLESPDGSDWGAGNGALRQGPPGGSGGRPSNPGREPSIVIPGGLPLLAASMGLDAGQLAGPDAAERVFSHILELTPISSENPLDNPVVRDIRLYLRDYEALLRHMNKQSLLPAGFDPGIGHDLVFPLHGDRATLQKTKRLLSFFGVELNVQRREHDQVAVELEVSRDARAVERQQLLRNLGVNFHDRGLQELRFSLRAGKLPLRFDPDTLAGKLLGDERSPRVNLLERMILSPSSMRLYLALAECSPAVRDSLIEAGAHSDLAAVTDKLAVFGHYLAFNGDRLSLPGHAGAWEDLLGVQYSERAEFLRAMLRFERGQAIILNYVLSVAPESVQAYFTTSPGRLKQLCLLLPAVDYQNRWADPRKKWVRDPGRLFRLLHSDEKGLFLTIDHRFGAHLFPGVESAEAPATGHRGPMLRLDDKRFSFLMESASRASSLEPFSMVDVLEFLHFVQSAHPRALSHGAIEAIMSSPAEAPAFLDLVWDLNLSGEMLAAYLSHCRGMARSREKDRVRRTRTSQAVFYLLSALRREGALSDETAVELFGAALAAIDAPDEASLAMQVARFLSDALLPHLPDAPPGGGNPSDTLLAALAGRNPQGTFVHEGEAYSLDASAYRLHNLRRSVLHQEHVPLASLLETLRALQNAHSTGQPTSQILEALMGKPAAPASAPIQNDPSGEARRVSARAGIEIPLRTIAAKIGRGQAGGSAPEQIRELAAALHAELGTALLIHCYAYAAGREIDALAFDPHFVRKHDFYPVDPARGAGWSAAQIRQAEGIGTHLAGSLAGLEHQLTRLEAAQAGGSFGKREGTGLVPAMLTSMRTVPGPLRTDRAQEYVALSIRLAREILAQAASDDAAGRWYEEQAARRLPPPRRERIATLLREGNPIRAARELSPSELFALGEARLGDSAGPVIRSPVLDRMQSVSTPTAGESLRREVDQYGALLRRRMGLTQRSLAILEPYEQLERAAETDLLYERLCDLKFRLAEINYSLGLPAYLAGFQGELAMNAILPESAVVRTSSWKPALERMSRIGQPEAEEWIRDLLGLGVLTITPDSTRNR